MKNSRLIRIVTLNLAMASLLAGKLQEIESSVAKDDGGKPNEKDRYFPGDVSLYPIVNNSKKTDLWYNI